MAVGDPKPADSDRRAAPSGHRTADKAIFWLSPAGYAQAPLRGARLRRGQKVPLRLLRQLGGQWEAELSLDGE